MRRFLKVVEAGCDALQWSEVRNRWYGWWSAPTSSHCFHSSRSVGTQVGTQLGTSQFVEVHTHTTHGYRLATAHTWKPERDLEEPPSKRWVASGE